MSVIHGAHVAGVTLRIDSKPRPGGGRWGAMGLKGAAATSPPERPRLSSNLTATSERRRSDPRAADCAWAVARRREYAPFPSTAKKPRLALDFESSAAPPRFPREQRRRPLIGQRPCDISAGLSSPQILFSPHRARPQDHARGSGAGDLRVHRSTPTSRRGRGSVTLHSGRVGASPRPRTRPDA